MEEIDQGKEVYNDLKVFKKIRLIGGGRRDALPPKATTSQQVQRSIMTNTKSCTNPQPSYYQTNKSSRTTQRSPSPSSFGFDDPLASTTDHRRRINPLFVHPSSLEDLTCFSSSSSSSTLRPCSGLPVSSSNHLVHNDTSTSSLLYEYSSPQQITTRPTMLTTETEQQPLLPPPYHDNQPNHLMKNKIYLLLNQSKNQDDAHDDNQKMMEKEEQDEKEEEEEEEVWAKNVRSRVWLVQHMHTKDYLVLKEIPLWNRSLKQLEHVDCEVEALRTFSNVNAVGTPRLLDSFRSDSTAYLVFRLLGGGPLHRYIRYYGGFDLETTRTYTAQLALALGLLHRMGWVHRDLKASNVMVDEHGNLALIDFGFANFIGAEGRTYTYCGTYHAMAPELHLVKESLYRMATTLNTRARCRTSATTAGTTSARQPSGHVVGGSINLNEVNSLVLRLSNTTSSNGGEEGRIICTANGSEVSGCTANHGNSRNILVSDNKTICTATKTTATNNSKTSLPRSADDDQSLFSCRTLLSPFEPSAADGYGYAVDWWALGILTFEMLTNEAPFGYSDFEGGRSLSVRQCAMGSPATLEASRLGDKHAAHFVSMLLESDPSKRLGSNGDVDQVTSHPFLKCVDWTALYVSKPPTAPIGISLPKEEADYDEFEEFGSYVSSSVSSGNATASLEVESGEADPFEGF